jgi:hypothetical protein
MPNDTKTWTVAGTSVQRGERTLRFANGRAEDRKRVLEKCGCTEVILWDLPHPMTKEAATAWLSERGDEIPVPAPRPERVNEPRVRAARQPREPRAETPRAVIEIAHEQLGRELYLTDGRMKVFSWDECSVTVQQEYARNAARAAGIETPRGTYPEWERSMQEEHGVQVLEDGSLVDTVAERARNTAYAVNRKG